MYVSLTHMTSVFRWKGVSAGRLNSYFPSIEANSIVVGSAQFFLECVQIGLTGDDTGYPAWSVPSPRGTTPETQEWFPVS